MKRALFIAVLIVGCSALLASAYALPKVPVVINAETLSGTLLIANPAEQVIYLKTTDGITYDFRITPATVISVGGEKAKFEALTGKIGSSIEVTFKPLPVGNVASKVVIP